MKIALRKLKTVKTIGFQWSKYLNENKHACTNKNLWVKYTHSKFRKYITINSLNIFIKIRIIQTKSKKIYYSMKNGENVSLSLENVLS